MTKIEQVKSTANSIVIAVFIINFMFQIVNGKDINEYYKNEKFMKDYDEDLVSQDSILSSEIIEISVKIVALVISGL